MCIGVIKLQMELVLIVKCERKCWRHKNDEEDVISWRRRCLDPTNKDTSNEETLLTSC